MFPSGLNQNDREQLARLFSRQAPIDPGPKSAETVQRFVDDTEGVSHDVGGEFQKVVVGPDSMPRVVSEQHARVLDCGHVVTSMSEILAMCDFGHFLCYREKLCRCSECRRNLCIEDVEERNGEIICPVCKKKHLDEQILYAVIGIVVALVFLLLIHKR